MSIKKSGHEILKGLFGDEKIAELEKRDDFIELKKKAEKLQADNLMDDLSSKINQNVDNFETKINMLKDFEHKDIIDSAKQKVGDIKDSVTDNVDEKVEEIKESLGSKAVAKLEAAVTKERGAISGAIVGTLGGFLVNMFKGKKGEKKGGIGGLFTKVALTLGLAVLGAFAGKKLMDKYGKDFKGVLQSGENSDDETDTPGNEEAPVKTQTKLAKKSTLSSNNAVRNATESVASLDNNNDKIEYKEKLGKGYQSVGFTLLNNLSGVNFDEQSSSAGLLQEIGTMSYAKLKVVMDDASRAYLGDGKDLDSTHLQRVLREELGLGEEYSGKLIFKTLQSIFSPFTEFIYTDRLALDSILPHLFGKNDDFTEKAIKILSPEELENIRQSGILSGQNHYYKILAMGTVSKLIALSFQGHISVMTSSAVSNAGMYLKDLFKGGDSALKDIKEGFQHRKDIAISLEAQSKLFPAGGDMKFGGKEDAHKLLNSFTEYEAIKDTQDGKNFKKFLEFRDSIKDAVHYNPQYNFGEGKSISETFDKGLNLGKVYALYLSLDGKTDVKNYDSFSKVTLYGWIYEVLSNANAGDNVAGIYLSNIWEELRKDKGSFNEDDKNLALVMAKRIGKPLDNAFNKKISSIDGFVISQISDMLISFKVPKDWAEEVARVIQIGGSVGLFLLIKNPYFRIALAGLTLPFIYTLVTKGVYVHLDQTVQAEIEAMVKKNAGYMTPPGENKEYYIDKVETLLAIKEDPEGEFERQKEKSFYKIEGDSMTKISGLDGNNIIAEVGIEGLIIHYNGQKYELKLGPGIDVGVTFRRQKINFKEIKIEQDKFIIGNNAYELPVNKISEIMGKPAQKLWKDSSSGLYYILEEGEPYVPSLAKNSWGEEIFEGISEKINEGHLIVQRIN